MKCTSCKKEAEIKIIYPFCKECFIRHYEKRVKKLIKKFKLIREGDKILVAISGGKDSLSCAYILNKLKENFNFKLEALHIDVGIQKCTNVRTRNIVENFCREANIEFHFLKFQDILSINNIEDVLKKFKRPICSICGMLKRYIFNKFARENNFSKIATGHCADDITKFFFKNWFSQNFDWISKFKPLIPSQHPKIVTRIRPLFECLEIENLTYAKFNNLTIAGCSQCSFFLRKDKWDRLLKLIDSEKPDFKINLVRGLEIIEFKIKESRLIECEICGEPTNQEICGVCKLKNLLNNYDIC